MNDAWERKKERKKGRKKEHTIIKGMMLLEGKRKEKKEKRKNERKNKRIKKVWYCWNEEGIDRVIWEKNTEKS